MDHLHQGREAFRPVGDSGAGYQERIRDTGLLEKITIQQDCAFTVQTERKGFRSAKRKLLCGAIGG